jgi:hypothetical protein
MRIRREYEENTKDTPRPPPSNRLAAALQMALAWLFPRFAKATRALNGPCSTQNGRMLTTPPARGHSCPQQLPDAGRRRPHACSLPTLLRTGMSAHRSWRQYQDAPAAGLSLIHVAGLDQDQVRQYLTSHDNYDVQ